MLLQLLFNNRKVVVKFCVQLHYFLNFFFIFFNLNIHYCYTIYFGCSIYF